jgi:hypothetical protein
LTEADPARRGEQAWTKSAAGRHAGGPLVPALRHFVPWPIQGSGNLFLTISFYDLYLDREFLMVWSRKLPKPIYLNDGRTIGTLAAARDLMLSLPSRSQTNVYWQDAAEILLETARNGRIDPLRDAGAQVSRALQAEGLI